MNDAKYIGLDVHQATISAAVLDSTGKLVMECVLETKATTIRQFIHGLLGSLHVTFEEGTCAAWLHDLLKPHVTEVLVCNPRNNALLKVGEQERPHRCSKAGRSVARWTCLVGLLWRKQCTDIESESTSNSWCNLIPVSRSNSNIATPTQPQSFSGILFRSVGVPSGCEGRSPSSSLYLCTRRVPPLSVSTVFVSFGGTWNE
jgi:hypothetical protein